MLLQLPCTMDTFDSVFPTEEACREFWDPYRWPLEFVCPRCGCSKGWYLAARGLTQCAREKCRYQASATAGTLFHKTKLSLRTWMRAIGIMPSFAILRSGCSHPCLACLPKQQH